jgi:hypothetical protein
MWSATELARIAADAIARRVEELRVEQAVRGVDALAELGIHPILGAGFAQAGLGVYAEQPYPGEPALRPRHAERERCDLVLTESAAVRLCDPVAVLKEGDKARETLFAAALAAPTDPGTGPEEAFWLEIKVVGQHTFTRGVPGPNRTYSAEVLVGPAEDAIKLEWDPHIRHAAVLLVLFTECRETALHDLGVLMHRLLDRELPVSSPVIEHVPIPDMIGNQVCTVALVPLSKL